MNIRNLKDSDGNVFSPKVSADSVYLSGSTENLTTKLSSIPTKTSQLTNDSGFATGTIPTKTSQLTNDSGFVTGTIPTKTSQLTNDSGFITSGSIPVKNYFGDGSCYAYCGWSNELNFGGSNGSGTIYFGYRAIDSKPIPSEFKFGGTSGSANVYAGGFYVGSSRSLKENISATKISGEEIINSVSIVDFTYKADAKHNPKVGFIAEDTDPLLSTPEKKAMDHSNCIGILMKAVQELSSKVKNLTSELDKLTSKVGGGWKSFRILLKSFSVKLTFSPKESTFLGWKPISNNISKLTLPMNYRRVA